MRKNRNRLQAKENAAGWAFVTPALITFLVLTAFPFFFSLFLSFTKWNFLSGWSKIKWIGMDNFTKIFKDRSFVQAIKNTFVYVIATVPISIIIALVLAYILNGNVKGKNTLRLAFFIPYICSAVALGAVFKSLFREDGLINSVLMNLHLIDAPLRWMVEDNLSKIPIILLIIYTSIGYEMLIYMAALQNVPKTLYEAATLDGATGFKQFVHITFPLISPTTFYLIIVRLIAVFKVFSSVNIMTMGSKALFNTSMVNEIYDNAFVGYKFGYAAAESMVLFVIILVITVINFIGQKKWVHY